MAAWLCAPREAPAQPTPASHPTSAPSSQPTGGVVAYQPGVTINWPQRQVEVAATVILRDVPIELFACSPQAREHESIIRIEARPLHVFEALGLIGVTHGAPVRWDESTRAVVAATGDPVVVSVRYEQEGQTRTVSAWEWLKRSDGQPLDDRPPWVFAGSIRDSRGGFAADHEGTVVAVVDFPTALLSLQSPHSADNDELWVGPNPEAIPPIGTACTLILRPADGGGATISLRMDRFAEISLDGKAISLSELESRVRETLRAGGPLQVELVVSPLTAPADVQRLQERLTGWGVPADRISVRVDETSSMRPNDPEALLALLRRGITVEQGFSEALREQRASLMNRLRRASEAARALADSGGAVIDESIQHVRALTGDREAARPEPSPAPNREPE
jgi:hypothetical protein